MSEYEISDSSEAQSPSVMFSVCALLIALDALMRSVQNKLEQPDEGAYGLLQLELVRKVMTQVQAFTWDILSTLDNYLSERG